MLLAAGQYFVIVAGDFDLSVGSLVTAEVVIAARLIDGEDGRTWPVVALLLGFGLLVGLVNGADHHQAAGAVVHHHPRHAA